MSMLCLRFWFALSVYGGRFGVCCLFYFIIIMIFRFCFFWGQSVRFPQGFWNHKCFCFVWKWPEPKTGSHIVVKSYSEKRTQKPIIRLSQLILSGHAWAIVFNAIARIHRGFHYKCRNYDKQQYKRTSKQTVTIQQNPAPNETSSLGLSTMNSNYSNYEWILFFFFVHFETGDARVYFLYLTNITGNIAFL